MLSPFVCTHCGLQLKHKEVVRGICPNIGCSKLLSEIDMRIYFDNIKKDAEEHK